MRSVHQHSSRQGEGRTVDSQRLEYDHFGPWVLEVASDDPPPPVFVPYLMHQEAPLIAVKVPRRIERRDAHPGMDLYDYLICLYDDDLEVMQRDEREVRVRTCRYRDIGHLSVTRTLLHGNIRLGLPGGPCDVPFNTAADDPIRRVIGLIRGHCHPQPTETTVPTGSDPCVDRLSFYFRHLLADLRTERPTVRLLALQDTVALGARETTATRRLFLRAAGKRLLESMHCSDGQELIILGRGQRDAYRWESVYGEVTSYIPLDRVREVGWREDAANQTADLSIRTDGGVVSYAFTHDNPSVEAYRAYLSQLQLSHSEGRNLSA